MESFKATTLFICLCLVLLASCSGKNGASLPSSTPAGTSTRTSEATRASVQSANWKVAIDSVKKSQPDTLEISLQIEYLGPDGNVKAPLAKLANKDGEVRLRRVELSLAKDVVELGQWLSSSKGKSRAMKRGDKLSPVYIFEDPKDYEDLMLSFADAPPLPVKVSSTDIKP